MCPTGFVPLFKHIKKTVLKNKLVATRLESMSYKVKFKVETCQFKFEPVFSLCLVFLFSYFICVCEYFC